MRRRNSPLALTVAFSLLTVGLFGQVTTYTWTGGANTSWWTDTANWAGGVVPIDSVTDTKIVFGVRGARHIDFSEFYAYQVHFNGNRESYELHGAADTIHLGAGGIIYQPTGSVSSQLNSAVALHASQTWNIQAGELEVQGGIGENPLSSGFTLEKTGAGTLSLTNDYSSWTGGLILTAGRVEVKAPTWETYTNILGDGTLVFNGGTLVTRENDYNEGGSVPVKLPNDIISNGLISTRNGTELKLGYTSEGSSTITLAADTTIQSTGRTLFLEGVIGESGGARKLTIDSDGAVVITGVSGWTGGTAVTKGVLIFAGEGNTPGLTGGITIGANGYAGITINNNIAGFLGEINPTASTGTIGFDSDPNGATSTFAMPIDLTGFNAAVRLGSATKAILGVDSMAETSAIITPQGNSYRFGGGGGYLEVQTALSDAAGPTVRNVVLDSPAQLPLTVRFSSSSNSFTGGVSATHSAAIFDPASLPGSGTLSLGTGGYIGLENAGMIDASNAYQDFINRFASTTDRGMIGFDGTTESNYIAKNLSLAGFSDNSPGIYLGTATTAIFGSSMVITPQGSAYRFGAYKGGELTVESQLTGAGNSVYIGDPTSLGTMGDFNEERYSTVILKGDNSYGGTTTLYAGRLHVGQTNGSPGTDPTSALGTGALVVQPHSLTLPGNLLDTAVYPQLTADYNVTIPNALQLNANLSIGGDDTSFTLGGQITGSGRLILDGDWTTLNITNANPSFSGGITLGGYENEVVLGQDNSAGTGMLRFTDGSYSYVTFQSANPTIGGLSTDHNESYTEIYASQPNTVITVNQASDASFRGEIRSDDIGDSVRLVKNGTGILVLENGGLYHYHGPTAASLPGTPEVSLQVNAGTVVIDNDFYIESSSPTFWINGGSLFLTENTHVYNPVVVSSGAIGGNGFFQGNISIGSGAKLLPGYDDTHGRIGSLSIGELTLASGGIYEWDIGIANPSDPAGHDKIVVSMPTTLTVDSTAGSPFVIRPVSLNSSGVNGILGGFEPGVYSWVLMEYQSIAGADLAKLSLDLSQFQTSLPGTFELQFTNLAGSGELRLNFTAVPEPSTYALIALGLGLCGIGTWRRRRA